MPADIDARRYYRVAFQRFEDVSLMLDQLDRPKAAVYLAGYATECILKALLINATPVHDRLAILRTFRGAIAHDVLWLRERVKAARVAIPMAVAKELAYVASWSVDLRYEPGAGDRDDAQCFIASTRTILDWADRGM